MSTEVDLRVVSAIKSIITGGDAIVEVTVPVDSVLRVWLNGEEVTPLWVEVTAQVWRTLLSGFTLGDNELIAQAGEHRAQVQISNYPVEGPIFSGPHLQPWKLTTEANGLGPADDEHGNVKPRVTFHYMNVDTKAFEPYDIDAPPTDSTIATTTTDEGNVVPYIVRHEIGAANRAIYEIAVLSDPHEEWTALAPQSAWNRKLWLFLYGGWNQFRSQSKFGIGQIDRGSAETTQANPAMWDASKLPNLSIFQDIGLRRGYMVARSTGFQAATNSDSVRGAESLLMLKEHITKRYGDIRFTFSSGASGGSMMQQMIANQYPGLLQGVMPLSSLHSMWYVPGQVTETRILDRIFTDETSEMWQSEADRLAVDGHWGEIVRDMFNSVFVKLAGDADPTRGTNLPAAHTYHPHRNPSGVRATLQDYQVNYLGRRERESWTDVENSIGRGFAHRPNENVGIQYGLGALLKEAITVEQFLDLNEKFGWVDIDGDYVPERWGADPGAVETLHRTGLINDFANMSEVAIMDVRPPEHQDPVPTHTQFHTWIAREALIEAQGHADNQVVWMIPEFKAITPNDAAFEAMDRWLTAITLDTSDRPLSEKVVANKPGDITDGLWTVDGHKIGGVDEMHRLYPAKGDARSVASDGNLAVFRIGKPQLKLIDRGDYEGVYFTDSQWFRLQTIFPDGVADWTKPGIGQVRSVPWLDYTDGPGGTPLESAAQINVTAV